MEGVISLDCEVVSKSFVRVKNLVNLYPCQDWRSANAAAGSVNPTRSMSLQPYGS